MDYYSHLQKSARECLRGYWLRIIIAYAVWQAASALASVLIQFAVAVTGNYEDLAANVLITLGMSVISLLISSPLLIGFKSVIWHRCDGETPSLSLMAEPFASAKRLFGCYALRLLYYVLTALPPVLLCAPAAVYYYLAKDGYSVVSGAIDGIIKLCCTALCITAVWLCVMLKMRYFAADFIFVSDDSVTAVQALRRSHELTRGKSRYTFALFCRFLPWLLLNVTGFAALYVEPYYNSAFCMYTRDLIKYEPKTEKSSGTAVFGAAGDGGQA